MPPPEGYTYTTCPTCGQHATLKHIDSGHVYCRGCHGREQGFVIDDDYMDPVEMDRGWD